jgi:hypothetical protein
MRAFFRLILNLALLVSAAAAIGWLTTQEAYHHASRDARIVMVAAVAAGFFIVACIVLHAVPSKAQLARRSKGKGGRLSYPYAAPAKRGRRAS